MSPHTSPHPPHPLPKTCHLQEHSSLWHFPVFHGADPIPPWSGCDRGAVRAAEGTGVPAGQRDRPRCHHTKPQAAPVVPSELLFPSLSRHRIQPHTSQSRLTPRKSFSYSRGISLHFQFSPEMLSWDHLPQEQHPGLQEIKIPTMESSVLIFMNFFPP